MKLQKGFTLLEILLVIAAIGILAAIVIVAINPNRQLAQARDAERSGEVNALYKSLEQFLLENGSYPSSVEALSGGDAVEICAPGIDLATCQTSGLLFVEGDLTPTYLADIPIDPSVSLGNGTGYFVYRGLNGAVSVSAWNVEEDSSLTIGAASELDNPVFSHYLPITIQNTGGVLTDQDILLTVDTESLITQGIIQNDCDDVAFAQAPVYDNFSALPFVLAGECNSVSTRFIVKADELVNGENTFYIHAGNSETGSLATESEFAWLEYGSIVMEGNYWFDSIQEVISLNAPFTTPRVISQVMTYNGGDPVVSRVKGVSPNSFELFLLEADAVGGHTDETVTWMAVEEGHWLGFDGVEIQSGIHATSNFHDGSGSAPTKDFNGDTVNYYSPFGADPSVFATLNTYNNNAFMTDVIHQVGTGSFLLEQEKGGVPIATVNPTSEDIAWVAFERGEQDLGDVHYRFSHRSVTSSNGVENAPTSVSYSFANVPTLFAQGSTGEGNDGYWMRGAETTLTNTQTSFYAEEDRIDDEEQSHAAESFSWMALDGDTTIPLASYYDESQIAISAGQLEER